MLWIKIWFHDEEKRDVASDDVGFDSRPKFGKQDRIGEKLCLLQKLKLSLLQSTTSRSKCLNESSALSESCRDTGQRSTCSLNTDLNFINADLWPQENRKWAIYICLKKIQNVRLRNHKDNRLKNLIWHRADWCYVEFSDIKVKFFLKPVSHCCSTKWRKSACALLRGRAQPHQRCFQF